MKVSFTDYVRNKSTTPIEMTADEGISSFYELQLVKNNFIIYEINEKECMQFMVVEPDQFIADVPIIKNRGSYSRECTFSECIEYIRWMYIHNRLPNLEGFQFALWTRNREL